MKSPEQISSERQAVIAEALTWLRTDYHHAAKLKCVGVDCVQLLIAVYQACGLVGAVETGEYVSDWMLHHSDELYLKGLMKYARPVETPKPGDIAMFKFGRTVSHAAIVVEWPQIIHAHKPEKMVVLGEGDKGQLADRLHGFFSVWGNE